MSPPRAFTWIEEPSLAAMAFPETEEELRWLKEHGVEVLVSLTEDPPDRRLTAEVGLLIFHVPVPDMTAPTQEELDRCLSAIDKARQSGMGVAIHCGAGQGRTGVVIACYFVHQGATAREAIRMVRRLRPGSIETEEQVEAVREFARTKGR